MLRGEPYGEREIDGQLLGICNICRADEAYLSQAMVKSMHGRHGNGLLYMHALEPRLIALEKAAYSWRYSMSKRFHNLNGHESQRG